MSPWIAFLIGLAVLPALVVVVFCFRGHSHADAVEISDEARARKAEARARQDAERAKVVACEKDGGHVFVAGRCVGCSEVGGW